MKKERAIEVLKNFAGINLGFLSYEEYEAMELAIKALEQPQGEWLLKSGKVAPSGFGTYICSRCGTGIRGIKSKMPYCTCGARMKGDEE